MGITSVYRKLEAQAPTVEQIAARKKRLGQRLSRKELAQLASRKKAKANTRKHGNNVATRRDHPERIPSPPITVSEQTGGYVRSNPQSGAQEA